MSGKLLPGLGKSKVVLWSAGAMQAMAIEPMPKKTYEPPKPPWELSGTKPRFAGHRVAFSGKFETLRKKDVIELLEKEGAKIDAKLGGATSLLVYAKEGSANHKKVIALQARGMPIAAASEDEFRGRYLVPTADQVVEMLGKPKDRKRLERLLEQARKEFSRGTDEHSSVVLQGRKLEGVDLSRAELYGVELEACDLRQAKLDATKLSEAQETDFRKATGAKCELNELRECDLRQVVIKQSELRDLEQCRLDKAKIVETYLRGDITDCQFDGATLDGSKAAIAKFEGCSFAGASLQDTTVEGGDFERCSFTGTDLRRATLKGSYSKLVLVECDLSRADLREATLTQVRFENCNLTGAKFKGATLAGLDFVDTDVSKAVGLDWAPPELGPALSALAEAAPTFKNIHVSVKVRLGKRSVDCELYQFDHGARQNCRQAWLDGDEIGSIHLHEAMATIAEMHPKAKLVEDTLVVKSSKGKTPPALKPKQLTQAVVEAWNEALGG